MRANCNNQEADNSFLYESAAATWRAIECVGWNFGKKRLTVRRVAGQSTEYHQHVVDVKLSHYLVRLVLSGRHRLRYNGICCFEWCAGTALAKNFIHRESTNATLSPQALCKKKQAIWKSYLSHSWYMRVVPRVVVNENGAIGHGGDLVTVIPPRHYFRILQIRARWKSQMKTSTNGNYAKGRRKTVE